jgi:Carboxypeptidase regulatory-like domain
MLLVGRSAPLFVAVVIFAQAHGFTATQSGGGTGQVRRCADAPRCVPVGSGTVVVYVRDEMGAAIGGAEVVALQGAAAGPEGSTPRLTTDWYGMAAVSLVPGVTYRLEVRLPGFVPGTLRNVTLGPGRLESVEFILVVDPRQLKGVLRFPTAE